ncbi:PepSY domain-containing protein [Streptomyces sp. LARHCF249]
MKRNVYVSAAAAVVLMAGGPVAAAAAASADTARTAPAAAVPQGDITAEAALAAALQDYPGVVESLDFDREDKVWHVDVITKDGKGHAELDVAAASGAVTRQDVDTDEDSSEHKDLLAAKVTAEQAAKAAAAAHPGQVRTVEWDSADDGRAASWHVEVEGADGKTWDASVDATTGKATTRSDSGNDHG